MVGVLIPVIGILVTLIAGDEESPPSPSSKPSTDTTKSVHSTPSATVGGEDTGGNPPKVSFGPGLVDAPKGREYIDVDTSPPLVLDRDTKGADFYLSPGGIGATTGAGESGSRLAPLPFSGSDPSEAECAEQVRKNGTYHLELTRGARICALSREGRTAYLRTVSASTDGPVRFAVTVWELPG